MARDVTSLGIYTDMAMDVWLRSGDVQFWIGIPMSLEEIKKTQDRRIRRTEDWRLGPSKNWKQLLRRLWRESPKLCG